MQNRCSIELRYDFSELERLYEVVTRFLQTHGQTSKFINSVNLVLEEMVTNVIKYAEPKAGDPHVAVHLDLVSRQLTVTLIDNGPAFNPLLHPDVDTTAPIEDREIGGLGIHLVKKLVDHIEYQRRDNQNQLTLVKKFAEEKPTQPL